MDINQSMEEKMLFKQCCLFQKVYQKYPLTQRKAAVTYSTIYLPTITYPFPTTTLSKNKCDKAQSMTKPLVIGTMGYTCNMLKEGAYTPSSHGGVGMKHCQTRPPESYPHPQTLTNKNSLETLLNKAIKGCQIQAGIPKPILKNTVNLPWMSDQWIPT